MGAPSVAPLAQRYLPWQLVGKLIFLGQQVQGAKVADPGAFPEGESQRFLGHYPTSGGPVTRRPRGFWDTPLAAAGWVRILRGGHEALEFVEPVEDEVQLGWRLTPVDLPDRFDHQKTSAVRSNVVCPVSDT